MKKILLTIAMLGVALASTASAHPHGGCYHSSCNSYWYPNYCYQDYDDCDDHPHHHHRHGGVIFVP
jgi:hypothetical protein